MQNFSLHNAEMEQHERLRQARQRRYPTARAASNALRIPYGTLTGHESGSRGIKDNELRKYARAYRVELPWLAFEIGPMVKGGEVELPLTSEEERAVIEALRKLPPEEAEAFRNFLHVRTSIGATEPAPAPARKRGR